MRSGRKGGGGRGTRGGRTGKHGWKEKGKMFHTQTWPTPGELGACWASLTRQLWGAPGQHWLGELQGLGRVEHHERGERVTSFLLLRNDHGGVVEGGCVRGGDVGQVLVLSELSDDITGPVDLGGRCVSVCVRVSSMYWYY